MSPSLFCVYLDSLLGRLRDSGLGCHIGGIYLGALGYADDVTLLAPSRQALQGMLDICQEYATSHSMLFSTDPNPNKSKTKCMAYLFKERELRKLKLWKPTAVGFKGKASWNESRRQQGQSID